MSYIMYVSMEVIKLLCLLQIAYDDFRFYKMHIIPIVIVGIVLFDMNNIYIPISALAIFSIIYIYRFKKPIIGLGDVMLATLLAFGVCDLGIFMMITGALCIVYFFIARESKIPMGTMMVCSYYIIILYNAISGCVL